MDLEIYERGKVIPSFTKLWFDSGKLCMILHSFEKLTWLKIFINFSMTLYICFIFWLSLFHTFAFDIWATIWILAFVHFIRIFLTNTFSNDTNIPFVSFNGGVIYMSCVWYKINCRVIKINIITRCISCYASNAILFCKFHTLLCIIFIYWMQLDIQINYNFTYHLSKIEITI